MTLFSFSVFFNLAFLALGTRPAYIGDVDALFRKSKIIQLRLAVERMKTAIQEQRYRKELEELDGRAAKAKASSILEYDTRIEQITHDTRNQKIKAGRAVKCRDSRVSKVWKHGVLSSVSPAMCKPNGWSTGFPFPEVALLQTKKRTPTKPSVSIGQRVQCHDDVLGAQWLSGTVTAVSPTECTPDGWTDSAIFSDVRAMDSKSADRATGLVEVAKELEHPMAEGESDDGAVLGGDLSDADIDAEEGGDLPIPQEGESAVQEPLDENLVLSGLASKEKEADANKGFLAESWPECDINQEDTVDTDKVILQLRECTDRLKKEAEDTATAHDRSKQANYDYSLKFRNAVNLLGELGDLEKVKRALHSDHGKVRNNLVGRVNTISYPRQMRDYALPTHMFTAEKSRKSSGADAVLIGEADMTSKRMPSS